MRENLSKGTLVSLLVGGLLVVPATLPAAAGLLPDLELPAPRHACGPNDEVAQFTLTSADDPGPYDALSKFKAVWDPAAPFDDTYTVTEHRWIVWLQGGADGDGYYDDTGFANRIYDTDDDSQAAGPQFAWFTLPDVGTWLFRHEVTLDDGDVCQATELRTTQNTPPMASFDPDQFQDGGFGIAKHHQDTGVAVCVLAGGADGVLVEETQVVDYIAVQPFQEDFYGLDADGPVVRLNEGTIDVDVPPNTPLASIEYEMDAVPGGPCADFETAPPLPTTLAIDDSAGTCFDRVFGGRYTDTDGAVSIDMDVLRYDSTLPITTLSTTPPGPGPFSGPVNVNLHREDDGPLNNGIAQADEPIGVSDPPCTHIEYTEVHYVIDGGPFNHVPTFFGESDASFTVDQDGTYVVVANSRDYAHNEAGAQLAFMIDSTAPLLEIVEPEAILGNALVVSAGFNVEIGAEASDALSGLNHVDILVDGESLTEYPVQGASADGLFTAQWVAEELGWHRVTAYVGDAAGNAAVEHLDVFVIA